MSKIEIQIFQNTFQNKGIHFIKNNKAELQLPGDNAQKHATSKWRE